MEAAPIKPRIPEEEYIYPGHLACPGCGASLAMRYALKALGPKTMVVIPACCWSIIAGPFPYSTLKVPIYHTAFETAASTASGMSAALDQKKQGDITVMAWAGDGGTFDIGFQALSGAAERNENFIYVCYDNEAYMNTGIQRSSATPYGAWTTTTPERHLKERPKKDIMAILAAHQIPYAATAAVAYPEDMIRKFKKAKTIRGTRFIHIFSPCPPGWKIPDSQSINVTRLAVNSKSFPLYEVEYGEKYRITVEPRNIPVQDYLKVQGRFRKLTDEDIRNIQHSVDKNWERLLKKVRYSE
ncbi:pyruvate synthase subunit PorB [bacterium BMS3Abin05]|nr:pyruvate synthase subunit PorB [bacterium BMS3Abin05]HDK36501.1 3-methyl-2-oxobutanoate dehydrogenase subunit beta [Bacteroidota bacterium]